MNRDPAPSSKPLDLVLAGWRHLDQQRPLAAWASWQRAIRADEDQAAARIALDRLATSAELPASSRREYRFRAPRDESRRIRWDAAFLGHELSDLEVASRAFAELFEADPSDADALHNRALCLAWLGRNNEALDSLDRLVGLLAEDDFEAAVAAWVLCETLRQGGGSETRADEFRHTIDVPGRPRAMLDRLAGVAYLRRLPPPVDLGEDVTIDEWLDRELPELDSSSRSLRIEEVPRVLAIVVASPAGLRFSLPSPEFLPLVVETIETSFGVAVEPVATPLPIPLLDAAAWTIRLPQWLEEGDRLRLYRESVEDYYENRWLRRVRHALGGRSPREIAATGASTEPATHARLEALIRFREELADRTASRELYQGYPFDRLRRRLGLPIRDAGTIDPTDPGCMGVAELDSLELDSLEMTALVDAFRSALALGDDERTARFASRLLDGPGSPPAWIEPESLVAPLVRHAIAGGDPSEAGRRIDAAAESFPARRTIFRTWRAELHSRLDEPERAAGVYLTIIEGMSPDRGAHLALDGAMTLRDDGHLDEARALARRASELASRSGHPELERRVEDFLDRIEFA